MSSRSLLAHLPSSSHLAKASPVFCSIARPRRLSVRNLTREATEQGGDMNRRTFVYAGGMTAAAGLAAWEPWPTATAGSVTTDSIGDQVQTLPKGQLPDFSRTGEIQRLYRYAVEHGGDLQYI